MAKKKKDITEKFEKTEFDLFDAIAALDRKDYEYYDRLTEEQKKKFVPYMLIRWMSAVTGSSDLQQYYLQSTNIHANLHFLNEDVSKNPKLQWLMLCAISPGIGKQFHKWLPSLGDKVTKLHTEISLREAKEYFKKIYPAVADNTLSEIATLYTYGQHKKKAIADLFPDLKYDEIDLLSELISDEQVEEFKSKYGE